MNSKTVAKFVICLIISLAFLSNMKLLKGLYRTHGRINRIVFNNKQRHAREGTDVNRASRYGLDQHIWLVKALSIDFVCNIPLFPKAPDKRMIIDRLEFSPKDNRWSVHRILGFLKPPKTGRYTFAISSGGLSEVWLSSNEEIENLNLVAYVAENRLFQSSTGNSFSDFPSQISGEIELVFGKLYFIEVLFINQAGNDNHVSVQWKLPGESNFTTIKKHALKVFMPNKRKSYSDDYDFYLPEVLSCRTAEKGNPFLKDQYLNFASHAEFASVLPKCTNDELSRLHSARNLTLYEYESIRSRRFYRQTRIFPSKQMNAVGLDRGTLPAHGTIWEEGADSLAEEDAMNIVNIYMNTMQKHLHRYTLQSIISVKKTEILPNGSRYLLDLNLTSPSNDKIYLSEYVYHYNNSLCYTDQWERETLITFIVTAKNQGKWIHVFLDNIANIIATTKDKNIHFVILDYDSKDIDVDEAIASRGLKERAKTVKKYGRYSRRESFNQAVELVQDPHSIVFLLDLHLTIGEGLVNDIRKHTIEGHLVYTPIIIRQWEYTTPHQPNENGQYGFYETYGYGLIGIFKSDWDRIGGFASPADLKNNYKWGGEDYELLDQVCRQGLEYYRIKCPYVYHFDHNRKGMWDDDS